MVQHKDLLQNQNAFLREWKPFRETYLFQLLSREAPPSRWDCGGCGKTAGKFFQCSDCWSPHWYCGTCCVEGHQWHPFHRIQEWTGSFFTPTTLKDLGFILHIGHSGGVCPSAEDHNNDDDENLVIVDKSGIHRHQVQWCACKDGGQRHLMLFKMGLFPASTEKPKTAFTFQCLDYFHLDSMECKTAANNFFNKLRRLTNKTFPDSVDVSSNVDSDDPNSEH